MIEYKDLAEKEKIVFDKIDKDLLPLNKNNRKRVLILFIIKYLIGGIWIRLLKEKTSTRGN